MSFSSVLDASLPNLSIDPRQHSDNKMSLHTYTSYVKQILGHMSHILALFVSMCRKKAVNVWIQRAHLSLKKCILLFEKSQCIHSVWSKMGAQFEDGNSEMKGREL